MPDQYAEGVIGRKWVFCPFLQQKDTHDLIRTCQVCSQFLLYCCPCNKRFGNDGRGPDGGFCHHYRVIFTDGACRQQGNEGATAGIGFACGEEDVWQGSLPVDDDVDPGARRTSQRAELLAALEGLKYMIMIDRVNNGDADRERKGKKKCHGGKFKMRNSNEDTSWIIATDSQYVVQGMTEWLPAWKDNHLRTNRNTKPANLDLFLKLDEALSAEEAFQKVKIGFWYIPRKYNSIADGLAKKASLDGEPA
ncbi:hypothetical protein XPA_009319 [Xanthoria parietina]